MNPDPTSVSGVQPGLTLRVRGMDCADCARTVESGVARLAGVKACEVNFANEQLRVTGNVSRAQVVQRVRDLGYDIAETPAAQIPEGMPSFARFLWERRETRLVLLGALLILPGLVFDELLGWDAAWITICSLGAMLAAGGPIALSAWRALTISRELNINVLMTIAAIGAVIIGAYTEAGLVMVLFALGEALEGYTGARARHSIRSLMEIAPETALRRTADGTEERVPTADVQSGDIIVVRPGDRFAMDGVVVAGGSAVNQAPITGESRLIDKAPGDEVFAGSLNGEGSLEVRVSGSADTTMIARMIRLVAEAQERRAPVERWIDRFARVYTPAVVLLAFLVAVVPPMFFGQPFWNPSPDVFGWFYRALALLVVACPCALVISTPVSVISALSVAARRGVLIKGGAALESLSRVQAVAFDKTGTLTSGRPAVVQVRSVGCAELAPAERCDSCDDLLALAYAVERRSEHPLAHAISVASVERGLDTRYPVADGVTALTGRGAGGQVAGQAVLVASHRHFDAAIPHDAEHCAAAQQDAEAGYTPVLVSVAGEYRGTITLADTLRPESPAAVAELHSLGLRVAMLTGDQRTTAERIAAAAGVTDVQAELLPEQKVAAVAALKQTYGAVAMVGDGINDTPALAAATVGVAVGAAYGGTNQAMETADITLMSDDLRRLPFAIRLSRATLSTVAVNIALSVGAKLVFLALVLMGLGTMWMAVLADVGVSLLVTLNGMRLLGYAGRSGQG